jgi:hypothetical protein
MINFDFIKNIFCKKDIELLQNKINVMSSQIKIIEEINNNLSKELEDLNNKIWEDNSKIPDFLDIGGYVYKPNITSDLYSISIENSEIYAETKALQEIANSWINLQHDDKLKMIWYYVLDHIKYSFDKNENWQFPQVTLKRKYGDCEDGTILFIILCKLARVTADKVFNACGMYGNPDEKIGHSYPIAKKSDGKWYIYETTLNFKPQEPKQFKGSLYGAEWGMSNWKFSGAIKNGKENNWQV